MTCKHCGAPLADGAKFCENCGNKIEDVVTETVETYKEPERVEADIVEEAPKASTYEEPEDASAAAPERAPDSNKGPIGYSIASLVCGILGLICCCCGFFGLVPAIAGIVLGIISIKKDCEGQGMAIAGIVCGGIGALFGLIGLIIGAASGSVFDSIGDVNSLDDITDFLESL